MMTRIETLFGRRAMRRAVVGIAAVIAAAGADFASFGAAIAAPPAGFTVEAFRASPPLGQTVEVTGFIAGEYFCPPCRKGAMCKPCMRASVIIVAPARGRAPVDVANPPADLLVIAARRPDRFRHGTRYRLQIAVEDRTKTRRDGRLLRFRREAEAKWTEDR